MPRASDYTADDRRLLDHLFRIHGKPERGYGNAIKYFRKVSKFYNSMTKGVKRTPQQIRTFAWNQKRIESKALEKKKRRSGENKHIPLPPLPKLQTSLVPSSPPSMMSLQSSTDIVCKNIRSLGSPVSKKTKSITASSSGYGGSSSESQEEYRSLTEDLPKSWEYAEISGNFLSNSSEPGASSLGLDDRDEPHIFDDIDNFSMDRTTLVQDKNGMSSDLVNILADQARQHHKLKIKLLKEKFRKVHEEHKMKMFILESELEMKRKEHDRKMDVLAQKYKKIKDSLEEQRI